MRVAGVAAGLLLSSAVPAANATAPQASHWTTKHINDTVVAPWDSNWKFQRHFDLPVLRSANSADDAGVSHWVDGVIAKESADLGAFYLDNRASGCDPSNRPDAMQIRSWTRIISKRWATVLLKVWTHEGCLNGSMNFNQA